MATKHNFVALRGETFTLNITGLKDKAGNEIDLTGHTIVLRFTDKEGAVLEEYAYPVTTLPLVVKASVEEVESWPLGNNRYRLFDEQPNGDVRIFAYGSITVKELD